MVNGKQSWSLPGRGDPTPPPTPHKKNFVLMTVYYHNIKGHFSWKEETRDSMDPIFLSVVETGIQYITVLVISE